MGKPAGIGSEKVWNGPAQGSTAATRMAPVGHTAAQWSQFSDSLPVTTAMPSFMVRVCLGQTAIHQAAADASSASITVVTDRSGCVFFYQVIFSLPGSLTWAFKGIRILVFENLPRGISPGIR
jgi:hypothetical protein